jgi:hypothetical protein
MPVGFTVEIPGMTTEAYDRVMDTLNWGPGNLPEGFISHYCCEAPGGLFIFDTWETEDDWRRFADNELGAAMGAVIGGQAPQMEPRFFPLHREEHR